MGFLVCVVRIVYLNLKSVADGREKGPGLAPTPGSTAQPHDRELKAEVLARRGHMEHVLFNNFRNGFERGFELVMAFKSGFVWL